MTQRHTLLCGDQNNILFEFLKYIVLLQVFGIRNLSGIATVKHIRQCCFFIVMEFEQARREKVRKLLDALEGTLRTSESGDQILKRIRKLKSFRG